MRWIPAIADTVRHEHVQANVVRHVRDLFKRLPRLMAFRLSGDLTVADVLGGGSPDYPSIRGLHAAVTQSIVELVECQPELVPFMRDRTFVRDLH
jgi:hypothetical protein